MSNKSGRQKLGSLVGKARGWLSNHAEINLAISFFALVLSVLIPFFGYYWFVPQIQEFENRGRLEMDQFRQVLPVEISAANDTASKPPVINSRWGFTVRNIGNLPAKDVQFILRYTTTNEFPKSDDAVVFHPPVDAEVISSEGQILIKLNRPIAPNDELSVSTIVTPDEVWAQTEYGERASILNTASVTQRTPKTRLVLPVKPVR